VSPVRIDRQHLFFNVEAACGFFVLTKYDKTDDWVVRARCYQVKCL